jgi:hypothetical protein
MLLKTASGMVSGSGFRRKARRGSVTTNTREENGRDTRGKEWIYQIPSHPAPALLLY